MENTEEGLLNDIEGVVRELVPDKADVMRTPTQPWDFSDPVKTAQLAVDLATTMVAGNGIGLAANQIGEPYRVFAIGNPKDRESIMVMFNPVIVDTEGENVPYEEGCLSFPGLYLKIKRPAGIRVRFSDYLGETTTVKYSGLSARIIQHEVDHLDGVVFTSKASKFHLDKGRRAQKKLNRQKGVV